MKLRENFFLSEIFVSLKWVFLNLHIYVSVALLIEEMYLSFNVFCNFDVLEIN